MYKLHPTYLHIKSLYYNSLLSKYKVLKNVNNIIIKNMPSILVHWSLSNSGPQVGQKILGQIQPSISHWNYYSYY